MGRYTFRAREHNPTDKPCQYLGAESPCHPHAHSDSPDSHRMLTLAAQNETRPSKGRIPVQPLRLGMPFETPILCHRHQFSTLWFLLATKVASKTVVVAMSNTGPIRFPELEELALRPLIGHFKCKKNNKDSARELPTCNIQDVLLGAGMGFKGGATS